MCQNNKHSSTNLTIFINRVKEFAENLFLIKKDEFINVSIFALTKISSCNFCFSLFMQYIFVYVKDCFVCMLLCNMKVIFTY